jgi:hypothetical protein
MRLIASSKVSPASDGGDEELDRLGEAACNRAPAVRSKPSPQPSEAFFQPGAAPSDPGPAKLGIALMSK